MEFFKYSRRFNKGINPDKAPTEKRKYYYMERINGRSVLVPMPGHLQNYLTEFNHLFEKIHDTAKLEFCSQNSGSDVDLVYSIPNMMRKFLECYLFFSYPNSTDPTKRLDELFCGNLPRSVNRVINEYSHGMSIERMSQPLDRKEVISCAKEILKAIERKNPEQYDALCESIGKVPSQHIP